MRSSARSPTPAAVPGCGRLGIWMRIFGGSPFSTSSHSAGVAINSPSLSRPEMSAMTVAGSAAGSLLFLATGFAGLDDEVFGDEAFDDKAFDDKAFDDKAFDDKALDDKALDDKA